MVKYLNAIVNMALYFKKVLKLTRGRFVNMVKWQEDDYMKSDSIITPHADGWLWRIAQ